MVQIACPEFRENRHLIIPLCVNIFTWRFHVLNMRLSPAKLCVCEDNSSL